VAGATLRIDLDNIFQPMELKKNQNLPKYIYNLLEKNLTNLKKSKCFQGQELLYEKLKKSLADHQGSKHSLLTMRKVLVESIDEPCQRKLLRLVLRKTLNQRLRKAIIPTKQEKNKMEYLVGTKVYALRCRHEELLNRVEFK
jgi:hypothetical protein